MKAILLFVVIASLVACKKSDYCDGCNEQPIIQQGGGGLQYIDAVYIFGRIEVNASTTEPADGYTGYNQTTGFTGGHYLVTAHTGPAPSYPTVEVWVPDFMVGTINPEFDTAYEPNVVVSLYYSNYPATMWINGSYGWSQYSVTVINNHSDVWLY
jgi:hypothetical protein